MRQIWKNWKILAIGISLIFLDLLVSVRVILGLNLPFYDDFMARRNVKKGIQMTVSGTVIDISGKIVSLIGPSGQTREYILPEQAAYFRAKIVNDKEFLQDMERIDQTLPQVGDLIFLNLFDENNNGHFVVRAVFLPEK